MLSDKSRKSRKVPNSSLPQAVQRFPCSASATVRRVVIVCFVRHERDQSLNGHARQMSSPHNLLINIINLARPERFERPTLRFVACNAAIISPASLWSCVPASIAAIMRRSDLDARSRPMSKRRAIALAGRQRTMAGTPAEAADGSQFASKLTKPRHIRDQKRRLIARPTPGDPTTLKTLEKMVGVAGFEPTTPSPPD